MAGFVTARDLKTLVQSPSLVLLSHGGPEQKGTQDLQSASVLGDPTPSCQAGTWSPQADGPVWCPRGCLAFLGKAQSGVCRDTVPQSPCPVCGAMSLWV